MRFFFYLTLILLPNLNFKELIVRQHRFYAAEISLALQWLHNKNLMYRALSLGHTLLRFDGHIKLIDFVVSKLGLEADCKTRTFCGQMDFMAPEVSLPSNRYA